LLIDAGSDRVVVAYLRDGMMIALSEIGMAPPIFRVSALISGSNVKSVKFGLNGNANHKVESTTPFALCGNKGAEFLNSTVLGSIPTRLQPPHTRLVRLEVSLARHSRFNSPLLPQRRSPRLPQWLRP
jgi:hypothetical protein